MSDGEGNGGRTFYTVTNREIYEELKKIHQELGDLTKAELPKRVRALELRFYGILAGLIGALIALVRGAVF